MQRARKLPRLPYMGRSVFVLAAFSALVFGQTGQDRSRTRGQTATQDTRPPLERGSAGEKEVMARTPTQWRGLLVDAECPDRESRNLRQQPSTPQTKGPAPPASSANAGGVKVDQKTLNAERSDIMPHLTQDLASRQMDAHCAISGATRAFALFLPNGLLLNLDEGGNTKAASVFQNSPQGQAVLNGHSRSEKPIATVKGRRRDDSLVVNTISLQFVSSAAPKSPIGKTDPKTK